MTKLFTAMAVAGVALLLTLPAPTTAKARTDGASNIENTEFSAQRRHWHGRRHWRGHRHWAHRPYWRGRHWGWRGRYWARPYAWGPRYRYWGPRYGYYRPWRYSYYRPYRYYRPYWGPSFSVGFWGGPRFGFWF